MSHSGALTVLANKTYMPSAVIEKFGILMVKTGPPSTLVVVKNSVVTPSVVQKMVTSTLWANTEKSPEVAAKNGRYITQTIMRAIFSVLSATKGAFSLEQSTALTLSEKI